MLRLVVIDKPGLFPNTPVNVPDSRAFTIFNDGNATLTTSNVSVSGEGFSLIVAVPASIPAGGNGVFRIRLLSSIAGAKTGQISFNTNDVVNNHYSFQLQGTVTP